MYCVSSMLASSISRSLIYSVDIIKVGKLPIVEVI